MSRSAFRLILVTKKVTDASYLPIYSFEGIAEGIDVSTAPSTGQSGLSLKPQHQVGRKSFSLAFKRYSDSCQNDPEAFYRFTGLRRDQTVSAESETVIVIFTVLKCGTSEPQNCIIKALYRGII